MKKVCLSFLLGLVSCIIYAKTDTISVYSKRMNKPIKVVVIQPDNLIKGKKLPVVYLLHGHGGNHRAWLQSAPQLEAKANELNMLMVMPDGSRNSWYMNSPINPAVQYEAFMINELVPYIDSAYPTNLKRAITGLSMGGHGAFYLSFRNKGIFGAAGSICGGVDIRPFPKNWELNQLLGEINEQPSNWEANTVINIAEILQPGDLQIIFDCGYGDFFLNVNRALHQKLLQKKIPHDYTERPGAHNSAYWGSSIDGHLLYFSKFFNQ